MLALKGIIMMFYSLLLFICLEFSFFILDKIPLSDFLITFTPLELKINMAIFLSLILFPNIEHILQYIYDKLL